MPRHVRYHVTDGEPPHHHHAALSAGLVSSHRLGTGSPHPGGHRAIGAHLPDTLVAKYGHLATRTTAKRIPDRYWQWREAG